MYEENVLLLNSRLCERDEKVLLLGGHVSVGDISSICCVDPKLRERQRRE